MIRVALSLALIAALAAVGWGFFAPNPEAVRIEWFSIAIDTSVAILAVGSAFVLLLALFAWRFVSSRRA
jgi:uncharacterized membrane-anchored protein